MPRTLSALAVVLTTVAAVATTADPAALLLDPFPLVRSAGDTHYTSVSTTVINKTGNGTVDVVKAAVSDTSHAVGNSLHSATDPIGNVTLAKFHEIDAAMYAARKPGCNPAAAARKPRPGAYAFLGSGNLLPFYQGVVQGLQDRRVLTPEVMLGAKFSGFSGGSLTVVLTGLGWSGDKQYALYKDIFYRIVQCKQAAQQAPDPPAALSKCTLNNVGIPVVAAALAGTDVPRAINGRVSIWACQINAMGTTLDGGVAQGTSEWASNGDVLANIMVSDQIPCFTTDTFYNVFRGAPYIDGGYCVDYAQLCPKDVTALDCLKISTEFLGPALPPGTPFPTEQNCPIGVVPPNFLPRVGKPYFTPNDRSTWKLPQGSCLSASDVAAVNVMPRHVPQGVTARPGIHPAFFAQLNASVFADGCKWLEAGFSPVPAPTFDATLDAMFDHGYVSGTGWADAHGYCA